MISAPGFVIYVLLLSLLAIGAWLRPPVAIAALGSLFALKQLGSASHGWLAANAAATNYAVALIAGLALVRRLLQGRLLRQGAPPLMGIVLALYGYMLVSLMWTPVGKLIGGLWGHDYPYMVLLVGIAPWLVATTEELQLAFAWFAAVGGVLILTLLLALRWGDRGLIVTTGALLDETNPLAIADVAGAVALCALFIVSKRRNVFVTLARLACAALCVVAIIRSGSRGQLLAVCVAILLMIPVAYPLTRLKGTGSALLGLLAVGLGIAWGVGHYVHWYDERWAQGQEVGDVAGRWSMVSALLQAWRQHAVSVIFGMGNSASFLPSIAGFYPHNVPLEILGEEGLIGFSMYLAMIWLLLAWAVRGLRAVGDATQRRGLLAIAFGCFIFALITTFKQGNAYGSVTFFMFAMLAARAAQQVARTTARANTARDPRSVSALGDAALPNLMR